MGSYWDDIRDDAAETKQRAAEAIKLIDSQKYDDAKAQLELIADKTDRITQRATDLEIDCKCDHFESKAKAGVSKTKKAAGKSKKKAGKKSKAKKK